LQSGVEKLLAWAVGDGPTTLDLSSQSAVYDLSAMATVHLQNRQFVMRFFFLLLKQKKSFTLLSLKNFLFCENLTSFPAIIMFHGIKVPIPCRTMVK